LTVLAIIGILLAVIIAIIVVLLLSSIRVFFSFNTENKPELKAKFLFFTVFDINKPKKKSKKPSRIGSAIKRMLGFEQIIESQTDEGEKQKESISSKVTGFVTVFMLLTDSNLWLAKKIKAKQLKLDIICGGSDAADAAIEYGVVCSAVYPFIGYLETNFKGAEKALDVNIGCDFENEAYFGTDIKIKLRIIHIVRALMRSASEQMEAMNEQ
jgi:hypothetical protein